MSAQRWWASDRSERYWLEATDRPDTGTDLRAPETDEAGADNWRYSLFKEVRPGDIVFHYSKRADEQGIVGFSRVAGAPRPAPIMWASRGTYARQKGSVPQERPGFVVPLVGFTRLPRPVELAEIRTSEARLRAIVRSLEATHGKPLYFPFELSDRRPVRLLQGYAFKFPRALLSLFPALMAAETVDRPSADAHDEATNGAPESARRNPPWLRDELILALELYLRSPASLPGKESDEVRGLSDLLNRLGYQLGRGELEKFRNPNGVYMKMMNFRRFDPAYTSTGRVGLRRGNKDEEVVWNEFATDRSHLARTAEAIRAAIEVGRPLAPLDDEDDVVEAPEGRLLTRIHRARERNRKLVQRRKEKTLRETGQLACEACSFDFERRYGERGRGFIECHHTKPVHTLDEGDVTRLEDLALLCANCHRMIHSARPWLSVEQLRLLLEGQHDGGL